MSKTKEEANSDDFLVQVMFDTTEKMVTASSTELNRTSLQGWENGLLVHLK